MPSIHDVAKRAGVSTATVSRTFGAPEKISDKTRSRVLEAAQALNYCPRGAPDAPRLRAAMRRSQTSQNPALSTVGFQFFAAGNDALPFNTFYAPVLFGVQAEAAAVGLHILVHTTDRHTFDRELPRMVHERAISGLLLVGAANTTVLQAFAEHIPHIVIVDAYDSTDAHDCILSDGFGGAYAVTQRLVEWGHRRIAFLNPEKDTATFRDRQRGYLCALAESGIPLDPTLCLEGNGGLYEGGCDVSAFLAIYLKERGRQRPTAIVVANDFYALQALQVCQALGLRVPEDISIAGFDDGESAAHCNPPLTTVHVDKQAMGRLALRRLQARLSEAAGGGVTLPVARYLLPVNLIVRASTRRAPEHL
ncbi:MAG: LacI family DNA-binding transcriptional regulator [bacterium]|jgi:hypothetical protein